MIEWERNCEIEKPDEFRVRRDLGVTKKRKLGEKHKDTFAGGSCLFVSLFVETLRHFILIIGYLYCDVVRTLPLYPPYFLSNYKLQL